jgi:hypothetical protein
VNLAEESADVTILSYEVDAEIGGKLAQLDARLINSTAKKPAREFFHILRRGGGRRGGRVAHQSARQRRQYLVARVLVRKFAAIGEQHHADLLRLSRRHGRTTTRATRRCVNP